MNETEIDSRYYDDFFLFANDLLAYHGDKIFELGEFHKEVADAILQNRFVAIMLATGHLKTTIASVCYPIWRMIREKRYQIVLTSSALAQSSKNLEKIKYYIENTSWLKERLIVGNENEKWNQTQITTNGGNTITVLPYNSSARGEHPNEIIYDDILREKDISMDQIKDIFWRIFIPRGQVKMCKHVLVGTPINSNDLFHEIREKKSIEVGGNWKFISYPAIIEKDGVDVPLWRERFSLRELHQIREDIGWHRFSGEYLCSPESDASTFFEPEMVLNCCDDNLDFSYKTTGGPVFIGADFAMSEAPEADFTVFTVVEFPIEPVIRTVKYKSRKHETFTDNAVVIKKIDRFKSSTGQVKRLTELSKIYNANKVIVDCSMFGQRFVQELRDAGLSVDAQDFHAANRSHLLIGLRALMESDSPITNPAKLIIPTKENSEAFNTTKHLIHELAGFRSIKTRSGASETIASNLPHDDIVFSTALAVKDYRARKNISLDAIRIRQSPGFF